MLEKVHSTNLDADESMFFARELEAIKAKSYDVRYPQFKATLYIPVDTSAGAGASVITYQQFNQVGIAKIISNYADDLPRADVFGKEFTSKVKSVGNGYGYNVQEIREAQMANKPLSQRKANSARRSHDQKVDNLAWNGDATHGMLGLLNQPNVPSSVVPAGAVSGNITWAGKEPEEILLDMTDAVTRIIDLTLGVEIPDTVLLPINQNRIISTRARSTTTDTTIKKFFMDNNPEITTIDWINELKNVDPAPSGGAAPTNVMITYRRDSEVLTLEVPAPYQQFPPQEHNLELSVPAYSRLGGVVVYYPLALDFAEGI